VAELTGQTFAGYEIVAKLGEGGMGAVYKAKQPILNRFVALKTMAAHLGGDKEFVARFQREAASAATLSHPNVVGVHTAGEVDGTHYIVMEFVEGESVRKRLDREGKIPPAEALAITIYVAQALQYAWNKARLIHRDIKPDNIFLSNAGEVKVGDLGLAKSLATEGTEMTATGMAMGSPHYISPEQATGIKDIDFRTDIYSLGCTLYHMLTGQTPYKGDSSMVVMMKHVHDPAPAIFKAWPQCPMPLGMLVGRMLAKDRNARPKSYEQLIADLFAVSEKLQQPAAPAPAPVATSKPAVAEKAAAPALAPATSPDAPTVALQPSAKPKSPVAIYAAAGVAALLALGGLFLWSPWKTEQGSESRLQAESASAQPAAAGTQNAAFPATEHWQDWMAEWRRIGKLPDGFKDDGAAWVCSKGGAVTLLANSIRDGAVRVTCTLPDKTSAGVGLGLRQYSNARSSYVGNVGLKRVTVVHGEEADVHQTIATGKFPAGFDPKREMTFEFRIVGDDLSCKLNGQTVATCRDSTFSREGQAVFISRAPGTRVSRIEVLNLDGASTFLRSTDAAPKQLGNVYTNAVGAEMVAILPGEFMMGSTKEDREWAAKPENMNVTAPKAALKRLELEGEQPPRRAVIRNGFWLGRTEVTVGQWRKFAEATGYRTSAETKGSAFACEAKRGTGQVQGAYWRDPKSGAAPQDGHAVTCISWEDATAFCKWLTEAERKAGRLPSGYVVRLPGEAEWEYACRGGKAGTRFWWGDAKEDGEGRLHWCKPSTSRSSVPPVDSFGERGRNGFGLADMLGNVWEWCLDNADPAGAHVEVFTGSSPYRVLKGGCFESYPLATRCASRDSRPADTADFRYGFRVCCGVDMLGSSASAVSVTRPASPVSAADAGWQDAINLLPLIDPQKDAAGGKWAWSGNTLVSDAAQNGRIAIPYQPPQEYDYRLVFHHTKGYTPTDAGQVIQILSKNGRLFSWIMGAKKGEFIAFETIAGANSADPANPTIIQRKPALKKNVTYTSLVEVRNDGLKAYLNGELLAQHKTDYKDMGIVPHWNLPDPTLLGAGSWLTAMVIEKLEVREVTGKGTFTRGGPASASAGDWTTLPNGWRFGKPVNLGSAVNSDKNATSPSVSSDGLTLFFCSDQAAGGEGGGDLWMSTRPNPSAPWGPPVNPGPPVNTRDPEMNPCLSADGLTLLFASKRPGGQGESDLWMSSRRSPAEPWGTPENLGPTINSPFGDNHPSLTTDGLTLLFTSRRRSGGAEDQVDLWMSTRAKIGAPWSPPVNFGPPLNSEWSKGSPCLSSDGLALFFESNRPGSRGPLNLWMSTRRSKTEPFGEPVLLPINTKYRDGGPALSADDRTLYFNSDRPGTRGWQDLWQVPVLPPDAGSSTPALQHSITPALQSSRRPLRFLRRSRRAAGGAAGRARRGEVEGTQSKFRSCGGQAQLQDWIGPSHIPRL
jgi:formylglycine-generating enzyme required for sulfatase activity